MTQRYAVERLGADYDSRIDFIDSVVVDREAHPLRREVAYARRVDAERIAAALNAAVEMPHVAA